MAGAVQLTPGAMAVGLGAVVAGLLIWKASNVAGQAVDALKGAALSSADFINPTSPTGGLQTSSAVIKSDFENFMNGLAGDANYSTDLAAREKEGVVYQWINSALGSWGTAPVNTGGATGSW